MGRQATTKVVWERRGAIGKRGEEGSTTESVSLSSNTDMFRGHHLGQARKARAICREHWTREAKTAACMCWSDVLWEGYRSPGGVSWY